MNNDQNMNSSVRNARELEQLNKEYRGQIIRTGVAIDAAFRRNGELAVAFGKFLDGEIKSDEARSALSANQPCGKSRFALVADLTDAACDYAKGVDGAMERMVAAAKAMNEYDAAKVLMGGDGAKHTSAQPKATISEAEAIAAIREVATKTGDDAVSVAAFNTNHPTLKHSDLVAVFGKWSLVQKAAELTVTKRGRKPAVKAA